MRVWWFDDGLGLLIFTPLLLAHGPDQHIRWRSIDFAMLALTVGLVNLLYFSGGGSVGDVTLTPTILIPPMLVFAMRFGIFWTALGVAAVSLATSRMVATGGRPWGQAELEQTIIHTQEFILTFSLICLGAAILRSQLRANERDLEGLVRDRTRALSDSLSHLEQAQAGLVQSEKLASLGALVAGVAHELNTPIGNAVTGASVLQHNFDEVKDHLNEGKLMRSELVRFFEQGAQIAELLMRSCLRASRLIESFKQVAVDRTSERRRRFVLAKLVNENKAIWLLGHKDVRFAIEIEIAPELECTSYPGPLGQIVSNLIQNAAVHAFDETNEAALLRISASATDQEVTMRFTDNGKGMDEATLQHIFDPFFTTQPGVGGSGLGLSISRNLAVGVLGGSLQACSTRGQGSSFVLTFPRQAQN